MCGNGHIVTLRFGFPQCKCSEEEMANENHGSAREETALMSHSPSTSHQNQPSSPKPARLVQDLPGTWCW